MKGGKVMGNPEIIPTDISCWACFACAACIPNVTTQLTALSGANT